MIILAGRLAFSTVQIPMDAAVISADLCHLAAFPLGGLLFWWWQSSFVTQRPSGWAAKESSDAACDESRNVCQNTSRCESSW